MTTGFQPWSFQPPMMPIPFLFSRLLLVVSAAVLAAACSRKETAAPATPTEAAAVHQPIDTELQALQGTWEGVMVGHESDGKITITIPGHTLHFHRDENFWFETTITLPADKDPKQFHATIKDCPPSQASSIGEIVRAFYKIEGGLLTLATIGDDAEETSKSFEASGTRYELRRTQP
jgi:uncharacterized protein (TIGR03067 family)